MHSRPRNAATRALLVAWTTPKKGPAADARRPVSLAEIGEVTSLLLRVHSDKPNTQITPPSGTSFFQPVRLLINPCWNAGSTPQPDTTATYCLPSIANDEGGAVMPELVPISHSTLPSFASNARNLRSLVPPANTRPPPVASIGPHIIDSAKVWSQTFLPLLTY